MVLYVGCCGIGSEVGVGVFLVVDLDVIGVEATLAVSVVGGVGVFLANLVFVLVFHIILIAHLGVDVEVGL